MKRSAFISSLRCASTASDIYNVSPLKVTAEDQVNAFDDELYASQSYDGKTPGDDAVNLSDILPVSRRRPPIKAKLSYSRRRGVLKPQNAEVLFDNLLANMQSTSGGGTNASADVRSNRGDNTFALTIVCF